MKKSGLSVSHYDLEGMLLTQTVGYHGYDSACSD